MRARMARVEFVWRASCVHARRLSEFLCGHAQLIDCNVLVTADAALVVVVSDEDGIDDLFFGVDGIVKGMTALVCYCVACCLLPLCCVLVDTIFACTCQDCALVLLHWFSRRCCLVSLRSWSRSLQVKFFASQHDCLLAWAKELLVMTQLVSGITRSPWAGSQVPVEAQACKGGNIK
jgi:hypothetical protein